MQPYTPPGYSATDKQPVAKRIPRPGGSPASLVAALGMSLAFVPSLGTAINAAPPAETGVASGLQHPQQYPRSVAEILFGTLSPTEITALHDSLARVLQKAPTDQ